MTIRAVKQDADSARLVYPACPTIYRGSDLTRSSHASSRRRFRGLCLSAALAMLAMSVAGCSSVQTISPTALPAALAAAPPISPATLDLSRLAAPRASSDVLQPGDQVTLTVATGVREADIKDHPIRLDNQGAAHVPLVGAVQLAGLKAAEAERVVGAESVRRGIFLQPQVSLAVSKPLMHRVTVAGAVEKPGVKELAASQSDLLAALSSCGTLSEDADTNIEITYPPRLDEQGVLQPTNTVHVDLVHASNVGTKYPLPDGAAVMVRRRAPPTIHVDGLVRAPKKVDLPYDRPFRLLDAIAEAGGRRLSIADRVYVSRIDPESGQSRVIEASYKEAVKNDKHNLVLGDGDVVTVQDTPLTFTVESVTNFIRFGFTSRVPGF